MEGPATWRRHQVVDFEWQMIWRVIYIPLKWTMDYHSDLNIITLNLCMVMILLTIGPDTDFWLIPRWSVVRTPYWPDLTWDDRKIWIRKSLNSNFANVQIDLDNLAQVLGSTSIQVGSKSGQTNSSNTTLPDDEISAAKNDCSGHTHCSASPTVSPLPDHSASHESSLPVFNVVTPPPKVPSMTSSVNSSPIGLQNRNSLTIGSDDYYWSPGKINLKNFRRNINSHGIVFV